MRTIRLAEDMAKNFKRIITKGETMERPKIENKPKTRKITGEIVYFDHVRRMQNEFPKKFEELSDMAIDMYDHEAALYEHHGKRPEIMDLYDEYDGNLTDAEASCIALADELLALKEEKSPLTFLDICVDVPPKDVLRTLQQIRAGELLAADNEQLAIKSNGEYYPVLDMRKEQAEVVGVGLRVWGWNHEKYTFTNPDKRNVHPVKDLLMFPSDEKQAQRQIELTFSYLSGQVAEEKPQYFTESVSLMVSEGSGASMYSTVYSPAYAETGYEGHGGKSLESVQEGDVAAFGDLVAEIVGDVPESVAIRESREVYEIVERAVNLQIAEAILELINLTWPAQANYILSQRANGSTKTIAEAAQSEDSAELALMVVRAHIADWKKRRDIRE